MPYVPTNTEAARLRAAVNAAALSEGERVWFVSAFVALAIIDLVSMASGALFGLAVGLGGLIVLYWRVRGVYLASSSEDPAGLFSLSLRTREQRAFTGLMLRQALTGRNPLEPKPVHDPFTSWSRTGPGAAAEADEGA